MKEKTALSSPRMPWLTPWTGALRDGMLSGATLVVMKPSGGKGVDLMTEPPALWSPFLAQHH